MAREKQVFPRETVAHLWAHAAQDQARDPSGNMYFSGPALHSYGRHYAIGFRYQENEAAPLFVMNAESSSSTTNKMRWIARRAVFGAVAWVGGLNEDSFRGQQWRAKLIREALQQAGALYDAAAMVTRKSMKRDGIKTEAAQRIEAARLVADYVIAAGKATSADDKKAARAALKAATAAADALAGYAEADNAGQAAALTSAAAILVRDKQRAAMLVYVARAERYADDEENVDAPRFRSIGWRMQQAQQCALVCDNARNIAKRYGFRLPRLPDAAAMVAKLAPELRLATLAEAGRDARADLESLESATRDRVGAYAWRVTSDVRTIREAARTARDHDAPETVPAWLIERAEAVRVRAQRGDAIAAAGRNLAGVASQLESGDSYAAAGHARDATRVYRAVLASLVSIAEALPATHPDAATLRKLENERPRVAAWLQESEARMLAENAATIAAWRESGAALPWGLRDAAVMLRIDGDSIATSHGASVPLSVAPVLWRAVTAARAGNAEDVTARYAGRKLGHYALNKVRADGSIVVGCHDIPYAELAGIAATLGYDVAGASVPA